MALLRLREVSKSFGGVAAVRRVSLSVEAGEIVGIMGPNGSGKTTLFNLISGALVPDEGEILLLDRRIDGSAPHRLCRLGIARTFQLVRPFAGLTVRDNVRVALGYGRGRVRGAAADRRAGELLSEAGLRGLEQRRAATLTVMERKRLELARALATAPRLLLLDEFMAGLNPAETEQAMGLIRGLQRRGLTLLLVEHVVWALLELSERVVVLSAGEKIAEGAPSEVARDPRVVEVYLGGEARA